MLYDEMRRTNAQLAAAIEYEKKIKELYEFAKLKVELAQANKNNILNMTKTLDIHRNMW